MIKPVLAEDGHIYEKAAILAHLAVWEERLQEKQAERQQFGMGPIPPQEMQELLNTRSPLRNGNVTIEGLKPLPGYYKELFEKLIYNYNIKVLEQQSIVAQVETLPQPFPKEVYKVIRFYEKTQRERSIVAADMNSDLLRSSILSDKEIDLAQELLNAAAKPPKLVKRVI